MAQRTFQYQGLGYADSDVIITASIDGQQIYSGPVPTIPGPPPRLPQINPEPASFCQTLFSWTADLDHSQPFSVEISMTNEWDFIGCVYLGQVFCNYSVRAPREPRKTQRTQDRGDPDYWGSTGPTKFRDCYRNQVEDDQGFWFDGQAVINRAIDGNTTGLGNSTRRWSGQPSAFLYPQQTFTGIIRSNLYP